MTDEHPGPVPRCAGRAAAAHERTEMLAAPDGWKCPVCGETMRTMIGVDVGDLERVLALADLTEDVGEDEDKARDRIRDRVQFAQDLEDGTLELVGPIPRGSAVVMREANENPEDDEVVAARIGGIVSELVRVAGHNQFTLLVVRPDDRVELLDEAVMRSIGWIRDPGFDPAARGPAGETGDQ